MNYQILIAFAIYCVVLFIIGYLFRATTYAAFALGNHSINYWVTAIAAHASDMSAWLFMGLPAAIYLHGFNDIWIPVGLIGGMWLSWHYIAQKLRVATQQHGATTLSSFFEKRFNDTQHHIALASSVIILLFFAVYIAAGLTGMGHIFESVFHMNYHIGMTISLFVSLFYIMIGGFVAVAWNHFFQGMFLLAMIALVPAYAWYYAPSTIVHNTTVFDGSPYIAIINGLAWGLGYLGMPHVIVNFMGIDNPEHTTRAKYLGMSWLVMSLGCATAAGFLARYYFATIDNPELIFVALTQQLFNPLMTGFILCGILAATMSTIDTQILVSASALTENIFPILYKKWHNSLLIQRCAVIAVAAIAYVLAIPKSATVMGLVSYSWSGLASAFSPITVAALYSKRVDKKAALASIIAGSTVSALWPLIDTSLLPMIPGIIASSAVLLIYGLF